MKIPTRPGRRQNSTDRRPHRRIRQIFISLQIAILVALVPSTSAAIDLNIDFPKIDINFDALAIPFDAVILRPLGAIRLVVGTVALIPIGFIYAAKSPIDGGTGALREVADILVVEPANFVFRRPLGEDLSGQ